MRIQVTYRGIYGSKQDEIASSDPTAGEESKPSHLLLDGADTSATDNAHAPLEPRHLGSMCISMIQF